MKTSEKVFNPILDNDVIAYRIVQQFKKCVELDEWFNLSTDDKKIMVLINNRDIYEYLEIAVNALRQLGYNVKSGQFYYGGPMPCALFYYPNEPIKN